jgi:hypothetical protein
MVYQLFVEEKNQPNQYHILEKKTTPHTPCAFINPYSNTKLLKIPNNFIPLEYP